MAVQVYELTTATTMEHFDAILKAYSENILKFLWDNGRNFTFFRYVTGKSRPPSPEILVTIFHGSREPPPTLRTYWIVPYVIFKTGGHFKFKI